MVIGACSGVGPIRMRADRCFGLQGFMVYGARGGLGPNRMMADNFTGTQDYMVYNVSGGLERIRSRADRGIAAQGFLDGEFAIGMGMMNNTASLVDLSLTGVHPSHRRSVWLQPTDSSSFHSNAGQAHRD